MSKQRSASAVFRVDATQKIGGGHIMRCLTLADELRKRGWDCTFASRHESVETVPLLAKSEYDILMLEGPERDEAQEIEAHIRDCDWLIVDHYGCDQKFERGVRIFAKKIMVIDDLANRPHDCDILLDQTFGRNAEDYKSLVPERAQILTGADYALLRPEFASLRPEALERREKGGPVRRILISLGASDPHGATAKALLAIEQSGFDDVSVDVVTGSADPAAMGLVKIAKTMPQQVDFHGFDADMATLMVKADLAIGAGGSTSWERCCLGLPTLMVVTADNQEKIARELAAAGAVIVVECGIQIDPFEFGKIIEALTEDKRLRINLAKAAAQTCDGSGVVAAIKVLKL